MKKLLNLVLLFTAFNVSSQVRFINKEYFTTSVAIDPSGSIKEGGLNVCIELELVSYWKYVKTNLQSFTALEGNYTDLTGGFGINLTADKFDTLRAYSGIRLGLIRRDVFTYPLFGIESGIDYNINEKIFVGLRSTYDYRSDFKFSGADPSFRLSGFVRIGTKF